MRILRNSLIVLLFFSCSPEEIEEKYFKHKEYELVFENDPEGITFYFTGVNYFDEDLEKSSGQYKSDGIRIINEIFQTSPFSEYEEFFNAYIVYLNPEPGSDSFESSPENIVRSLFPDFKETDVILISARNSSAQGMAFGVVASFPNNDRRIMIHELGHAVGSLGEEYVVPCNYLEDTSTTYNLDVTNNPDAIKWKHFIGLSGYEEVGITLRGCTDPYAAWKPTKNCVMNKGFHFCAPCREGIVKNIMQSKGLEYRFQDFILKDASN